MKILLQEFFFFKSECFFAHDSEHYASFGTIIFLATFGEGTGGGSIFVLINIDN